MATALSDRGAETDRKGKNIYPVIIRPVQDVQYPRAALNHEFRVRQLFCHQAAQREQRLFQALQKQRQTQQYIEEPEQDPPQVGNRTAQDKQLETEDHGGDGQHIPQGGEQAVQQAGQPFHQMIIP
jgi:hypothetical protein